MRSIRVRGALALAFLAALMLVPGSLAQTTLDMPVGEIRPYVADSGFRRNPADEPAVVYRHVLHVDGTAWLRVYFDHDTVLAPGSFIRMTSLLDAESQELDASALAAWDHSSAYFNGGTLLVELVAGARTNGDRLVIDAVALELEVHHPVGLCGICGADDRVPSSEDWTGRLLPAGCTASVYNEDGCLVSAGHCITGGEVIQFRVPASDPDCSLNHPPVADQFPVTARLFESNGVGNDWAVMTTSVNNLGETTFERYGVSRPIAFRRPLVGQPLDVWGYGLDTQCTRSQSQQTDSGAIVFVAPRFFRHDVDITFGNSGSAVIRDDEILGIITHCPCPGSATRVDHDAFTAARLALCGKDPGTLTNDDCADATGIADGAFEFSTVNATTDGPNFPESCDEGNGTSFKKDVWFEYVASCDGVATASVCDSDYDTRLGVYDVTDCPGPIIACSDDACGDDGTRSETTFPVTAGEHYLVRIGGRFVVGSGVLVLSCTDEAPCPEDLSGNGVVDFEDILEILANWGGGGPDGDANGDGVVNFADILAILSAWGPCP